MNKSKFDKPKKKIDAECRKKIRRAVRTPWDPDFCDNFTESTGATYLVNRILEALYEYELRVKKGQS